MKLNTIRSLALGTFLSLFPVLTLAHQDNFSYAGPYFGEDNKLKSEDFIRDILAANDFRKRFTNGFVTIFGGSNLKTESKTYNMLYSFSKSWSDRYGTSYPILTGAGPGAMEAGSRGAYDSATKISIGYTTYYKTTDPRKAFWQTNSSPIITDGLIFSSVSIRETMMILHSSAIIIAPGGSGTEWEIFQILEMRKSKQLGEVPIYLTGSKTEWKTFYDRIKEMSDSGMLGTKKNDDGTTSNKKLDDYFTHAEDMNEVIDQLATWLNKNRKN